MWLPCDVVDHGAHDTAIYMLLRAHRIWLYSELHTCTIRAPSILLCSFAFCLSEQTPSPFSDARNVFRACDTGVIGQGGEIRVLFYSGQIIGDFSVIVFLSYVSGTEVFHTRTRDVAYVCQ